LIQVNRNSGTPTSALIGASHELQSRLDVPPCRAFFAVSFFGKHSRFIGGYHTGFVAVFFQQLLSIFADLDFVHDRPHVENLRNIVHERIRQVLPKYLDQDQSALLTNLPFGARTQGSGHFCIPYLHFSGGY
jgi:hypothetical protein